MLTTALTLFAAFLIMSLLSDKGGDDDEPGGGMLVPVTSN